MFRSGVLERGRCASAGSLDLPTVAFPVRASRPTARSAFPFLKLLLSPSDAPLAGRGLLRIFDPADELVASQRRDVLPSRQRRHVSHQRGTQIGRKLMDHATRHCQSNHTPIVSGRTGRHMTV